MIEKSAGDRRRTGRELAASHRLVEGIHREPHHPDPAAEAAAGRLERLLAISTAWRRATDGGARHDRRRGVSGGVRLRAAELREAMAEEDEAHRG